MINALTIDVEDYFHTEAASAAVARTEWERQPSRVEASMADLLALLDQHRVKATLFVLGWVAEKFPAMVREAAAAGHEIGCHSYWHRAVFRLTPQEFREDTLRAKTVIESAAGIPVRGYRAPSFSLVPGTEWAFQVLAELGFTYDSSVNPIRHDFYSNANAPRLPYREPHGGLWELPIATARFGNQNLPIGGGAYLRILPLRYTLWGLGRINRLENMRAMFYLHPWEIDAGQPRLPLKAKSRLRQYTNLSRMREKLGRVLAEFSFAPAVTAFPEIAGAPLPAVAPASGVSAVALTR